MAKFVFIERQDQSYEMDVRCFIEGQEVTDWLHDNVGVTLAGTGAIGTCTFSLANPDDIWTLTSENLAGVWRKTDGLYTEEAKKTIYLKKKAREEAAAKVIKGTAKKKRLALLDVGIYNLGPEQLIFHKHDCVRLFVRNPLSAEEWWMPMFTGFIDHKPFQDDYVTGPTPVNVTCYDIKGLMKRMRVASNPMPSGGIAHQSKAARATSNQAGFLTKEGVLGPEAGIFEDLFSATGINHVLAGRGFEQAMRFLFFGEGGVLPGGSVNKFSRDLYGGLFSKTLSVPTGQTAPQQQKTSVQEQKILDEFKALNNKTQNIINSGGYDSRTGLPKNQTKYDRYYKSLTSEKDKSELRRAAQKAVTLRSRLEDAETRRTVARQRKKAQGQKTEKGKKERPVSASRQFAFKRGHVGRMEPGVTRRYKDNSDKTGILEKWQNLCLLGNETGTYLTPEQVTLLGRGTVLDPVVGSPFNAKLHMLLPHSGIPAKTFAQVDLDGPKDYQQGVSFQTRFELVNHICEQIDYQWHVTPNGDVAIEFPMYDFNPSAFGAYKSALTIDMHSISASVEDEASDVPTALVVTAQETNNLAGQIRAPARALDPNRIVVYAPLLAARLGASVEQVSSPVAIGGQIGGGGGLFGGGIKGAEAWALLQMQKRLGQSSTLTLPMPYRPWVLPNRPIHHEIRDRIGITNSVQHSLGINGVCNTTPVLWFVKKKHTDGKFRYPTSGGENMPINYSTAVTAAGDVEKSGIIIRRGKISGTSRGAPQGAKAKIFVPRRGDPGVKTIMPSKRWLTGESIGTGTVQRLTAAKRGWGYRFKEQPTAWVIHCNSSGGNVARYLSHLGDGRRVSVHFVIEPNGQVIQMLPLDHWGIHAGYGRVNRFSLGHEFRGPATKTYNSVEIAAFIQLIQRVKQIYPTIRLVYGHVDLIPRRRTDPGKKFPWADIANLGWRSPKGHF